LALVGALLLLNLANQAAPPPTMASYADLLAETQWDAVALDSVPEAIALGDDVKLAVRGDGHPWEKRTATSLTYLQKRWQNNKNVEVWASAKREAIMLLSAADNGKQLVSVLFIGCDAHAAELSAALGAAALPLSEIVPIMDGGLIITFMWAPNSSVWRVIERDGYVKIWPLEGATA